MDKNVRTIQINYALSFITWRNNITWTCNGANWLQMYNLWREERCNNNVIMWPLSMRLAHGMFIITNGDTFKNWVQVCPCCKNTTWLSTMACKKVFDYQSVGCTQGLCVKSNCEINVGSDWRWGSNVPTLQTSY
jgi:hypothetical protein